jgi:molecular chaperone DnaK (HSP70)
MGSLLRRGATVGSSPLLLSTHSYSEASIGDSAKNAFHTNPTNTVFDAKRLIGRKMEEPELQRDIKHWWVCFRPVFLACLTFGVVGRSKSLRRVVNPVYMSSTAAKGAIL